ncbi:MAG: hypothetical protein R2778_17545 [Saprospiraceae bacterium]
MSAFTFLNIWLRLIPNARSSRGISPGVLGKIGSPPLPLILSRNASSSCKSGLALGSITGDA